MSPIDPWDVERAKHPAGAKLLRFIDLERDEQRWIPIAPRREDTPEFLRDYALDGCTLLFPARESRTPAETARLIALYDDLYREQLVREEATA